MKGPFKIMLCGVIGLSIIWFFINLISSIFTNIFVTKNVDNSSVNKFIIESRCKWIKTQKDFYDGKKKIYVARQAEVNEFEILKREISIMKTDQKMISKIDISGISEDSSIRESNKIMNYINNAINELILALDTKDQSDFEKYIKNANTEIQLANRCIAKLCDVYNIESDLLSSVSYTK